MNAGKAKIMFRYATGRSHGNCDLLSLGIITRSRYGGLLSCVVGDSFHAG